MDSGNLYFCCSDKNCYTNVFRMGGFDKRDEFKLIQQNSGNDPLGFCDIYSASSNSPVPSFVNSTGDGRFSVLNLYGENMLHYNNRDRGEGNFSKLEGVDGLIINSTIESKYLGNMMSKAKMFKIFGYNDLIPDFDSNNIDPSSRTVNINVDIDNILMRIKTEEK